MGKIVLEGIEVYAYQGYYPEEQVIGGKYRIDLELECDLFSAEESDSLSDTINYEELFSIVHEEMKIPSKLLEHIGHRIIDRIAKYAVTAKHVRIKISKMHPPLPRIMDKVSIILEKDV